MSALVVVLICAQSPEPVARLVGQVQTMGTRAPVMFAQVHSLDAGVEADDSGRFELELPAGTHDVIVEAARHEPRVFRETLGPGQRVEVLYRLMPKTTDEFETVVRGRRDTEPPRVELGREETHELAGTQGDPLRVAMLLPGVASVASGLSYPVVRGTQPAATTFSLDGVRLPQLYHLLAGPSVIAPDFIERVDFYSGAVPVAWGRALGGVVNGRVARPSDDVHATASVDLINAGGFVTFPVKSLDLKVSVAGRASYTGLFGAAIANAAAPSTPDAPHGNPVANFYDYQARVDAPLGGGRVRLLLLGSSDEAGVRQTTSDTTTALLDSVFHRGDVTWRRSLAEGLLEVGVTVGTETLGLVGERNQTPFGQFLMHREEVVLHGRFERRFEHLTLSVGADANWQSTGLTIDRKAGVLSGQAASFRAPDTTGLIFDGFAEATWQHGALQLTAGLRSDVYQLTSPELVLASVEPRLSARYTLADWLTLRGAAGLASQPPTVLINLPVSELAGLRDGLQYGARLELGADANSTELGLELSLSGYFNPTFRAVEYSLEDLLLNRSRLGASSPGLGGRSYGLEVMLRRRAQGRWFGWLSYSLGRSERLRQAWEFDSTGAVNGSRVVWLPFDFDETHVLNLTGGVVLGRGVKLSAGLHVNSGRPELGTVTSRAMRPGFEATTGQATWAPVPLWRAPRLPPFFRVDVRVSKTWTFEAFTLEAYLDVLNVSATEEVLGFTYEVVPSSTGMTLSKHRFGVPLVLPFLGVKAVY